MRKKFKKLVGITTAVAMAVSLVPTNVFAEEPEVAVAEESAKNDNLLRVWYDEPATDWQTQSLAIGNGYMGSLVFGGINKDKIHINEKTVWEGGPTSYNGYSYGTTNRTETDADLHVPRFGEGEERRKLRVQQRLAHHMQVDVLHIPLKPREDEAEFLCAHRARRALRLGAEGAGEVAAVCDLDIGFFQHRAAPFVKSGDRFKYFTISARFCKAFSLAPRRGVCYDTTSKLPSSTAKGETA